MINNTLCSDYDSCVTDALNAKASKMAAKGVYCSSITECQSLVYADHNGDVLNVGLKSYASLADLMTGKYIPKRIYTVEEATKLSKETGNTFKLRYK